MLLILHLLHGRRVQQSEVTYFTESKDKAGDPWYTENRVLKELSVAAIETIERMDEDIELKDNKINVLSKELKDVNHYD
jgi:hypothetical protein